MPITSYDLQRRVTRFREQRWLLDAVVKLIGPEFDQSRLHYLSAPVSPDYQGAVMGLQHLIQRWDDISREFSGLARRFELQAQAAKAQGHVTTASDGFFAAALMYGGAQWPIFENTELNKALKQKKNDCFREYMKGADHPIEPIEIPYRGKTLPAHLHLPANHDGSPLPCVVMVTGMDAFKEQILFGAGDRFLRRGLACLVIDGPGQGTSLLRGASYEPEHFGEVGTVAVDWLLARKEIDAQKIMAWGLSFGSFWATQMVAAEPRFAACAVMYTCFQPTNWPLYEMAAPSFKQRLMYMTNVSDETGFAAVMEKMDLRSLSGKINMPYFVMAGEDNSLCDLNCTMEHMNHVPGEKTLLVYAGEEHGMGGARSSQLGMPFFTIIADWLADRAAGKPLHSTSSLVDRSGQMHTEPYGEERVDAYGAPLGVEHLFSDKPPVGVS